MNHTIDNIFIRRYCVVINEGDNNKNQHNTHREKAEILHRDVFSSSFDIYIYMKCQMSDLTFTKFTWNRQNVLELKRLIIIQLPVLIYAVPKWNGPFDRGIKNGVIEYEFTVHGDQKCVMWLYEKKNCRKSICNWIGTWLRCSLQHRIDAYLRKMILSLFCRKVLFLLLCLIGSALLKIIRASSK